MQFARELQFTREVQRMRKTRSNLIPITFGSRGGSEGFAFSHPAGGAGIVPPGVNYERNDPKITKHEFDEGSEAKAAWVMCRATTERNNNQIRNGHGNASETNRRTDAWRMKHDSGGGLGTHLADKRGRSGREDRSICGEIRIPSEALSKGNLRYL